MTDNARSSAGPVAAACIVFALFSSAASAQVFDLGPSDPALFTNGVFNLPPGLSPGFVGDLQQLNVADGGFDGNFSAAGPGSEVNITGGFLRGFLAVGSEVNISGGTIGIGFEAGSGSVVNVSGGTVGLPFGFDALSGSEVNISGGTVGRDFRAFPGSAVNISGGTFGDFFNADPGSDVELLGGEFRLNGNPFAEPTVTLGEGDIFTGTLQDGSAFIFGASAIRFAGVTLTEVALPTLDLTPIVVDTPMPARPSGLRVGQTLNLRDSGVLGANFEVVDATLNIEGGSVGEGGGAARSVINIGGGTVGRDYTATRSSVINISGGAIDDNFIASFSEVNISGGEVGERFTASRGSEVNISGGVVGTDFVAIGGVVNISGGALGAFSKARSGSIVNITGGTVGFSFDADDGSEVNISGGTINNAFRADSGSVVNISGGIVGDNFDAVPGSEVNLLGVEFFLNDEPIDGLAAGVPFEIVDRDPTSSGLVVLSGTLADGSPFEFELNSDPPQFDLSFFASDATLTVTLVPEPAASGLLLLAAATGIVRRRGRAPEVAV